MRLPRRDNDLNDALEVLDESLVAAQSRCKTDIEAIPMAWDSLSASDLEFVDREIERCISSRRYFMENYYVIRDEAGMLKTLYPYFSHQEIIEEAIEEEISEKGCARIIILKPRQAGSTTWNAAMMFHATMFVPNTYTLVMAQNDRVSREIYERVTDAFHLLPWWLRPEISSKQQGLQVIFQRPDEARRMIDPGLGSTLMISDAGKQTGVAIGKTLRNILASEQSRWPDPYVWTADIEPSLNAPDMLGVIESTAFGQTGLYYNMWQAAVEGESDWRAVFIPVYKVKKYFLPVLKRENFTLTADEKELRRSVYSSESYTIPYGFFKWRRRKIRACIAATGSSEDHKESYPLNPEEAFISSGACAFPRVELDRQQNSYCRRPILVGEIEYAGADQPPILHLHEPSDEDVRRKPDSANRLWIWEAPKEGGEYQIGCDQGGSGEDNDFTAAAIYSIGFDTGDRDTSIPDECVAEWHGRINASHMAKVLAALGYWYNGAEIAVEYARDGITTGNELQWTLDYPAIYRWRRFDKIGNTMSLHTHWITNSLTREDAINRMCERLLDHQIKIHNVHAIKQMRNFGREEGQLKAQGLSDHDDLVMAHLIAVASANQGSKRQLRAEAVGSAPNQSAALDAVMPKVPVQYAVYDHMGRMLEQVTSEQAGHDLIAKCEQKYKLKLEGMWKIIPVVVSKANTPWCGALDGNGAERELYQQGVDPRHQFPDLVYEYKQFMGKRHYEGRSPLIDEDE